MTRVRYILAAVLALAVVAFVVVGLWPEPPGVSQANFDRIQEGMTLEDAERIFGKSGDCMTYPPARPMVWVRWEDKNGIATLGVLDGNIIRKGVYTPHGIFDKVRRWMTFFANAAPTHFVVESSSTSSCKSCSSSTTNSKTNAT
jgi:hypothetical protein